ncbi:MAG: hypothetical protein ACI4PZ_06370 [Akkermansia sp.]
MKPTTYLIYNESTGEWNAEPVTLAAARALPGVTLSTYLSTTDGARQLTVAQAIGEEQAAAPAPTPAAHREPVYNAETNKWEYKEAAASVFNKIKSVASDIITEINEACKEQAEANREQHREPVYTLGGIPLETEPPKSDPFPSSPAPVPAEAVPVPPAGASVPNSGKQRKEYKVIEYTVYHNHKFDAEGARNEAEPPCCSGVAGHRRIIPHNGHNSHARASIRRKQPAKHPRSHYHPRTLSRPAARA